jgi:hypothetical protein
VFFAQFLYDLRARSGFISDRVAADPAFEFVHHVRGKTVRKKRKRLLQMNPDHLPMARGCVLPRRGERAFSKRTHRFRSRRQTRERLDIGEAEVAQIREMQRALTSDIAERIAARVSILGRVRHFADADAIENNPDDALESHGVSVSAFWMRSESCSTNRSGKNPFMRLAMRPCLSNTIVVGISVT